MIPHWNIIQGTEEWHRIKYGRVGGSLAKGLFVNSMTLLDELLSANLEPFELEDEGYQSDEMQRGHELEPYARQQLSEYAGLEFLQCGWLQCEEFNLIGISPDGITKDLRFACEIKSPQRKKHTTTIREGVTPLDHAHQIVHYFTVNPILEKVYFGSFRPESAKPLFVTETTRDTDINLGTAAKPVIKSVRVWVEEAKVKVQNLSDLIVATAETIKGI